MATILNIDTSTGVCSTALTSDGMILCHREDFNARSHAALLSGFIKDCLDHMREHEMKLDAVAVTLGPGSYTGLRIGLSEAKGLAYALEVPLIGLCSLEVMATGAMFNHPELLPEDYDTEVMFAPMIDARRMEVFTAVYSLGLETLMEPQPLILDTESYKVFLERGRVIFMGDGSGKAKELIKSNNAVWLDGVAPLATDMLALSERAYARRQFVDTAYAPPMYLKEFQATKPKNILGL